MRHLLGVGWSARLSGKLNITFRRSKLAGALDPQLRHVYGSPPLSSLGLRCDKHRVVAHQRTCTPRYSYPTEDPVRKREFCDVELTRAKYLNELDRAKQKRFNLLKA